MQESIDQFVDLFCDNEIDPHFESKAKKNQVVQELSANQFEQWVLDSTKTQCVIELTRPGCAACEFNTSIFSLVSTKLREMEVELDTFKIQVE